MSFLDFVDAKVHKALGGLSLTPKTGDASASSYVQLVGEATALFLERVMVNVKSRVSIQQQS